MTSRVLPVAGVLSLSLALHTAFAGPAVSEPWSAPFAKDTAAVLAAARAVHPPDGVDALVLLEERRYTVDAQRRVSASLRRVIRICSADAVEEWGSVEHRYAPWFQRRPEVKARVIDKDGAVHWLDAKTVTEAPAFEFDSTIFSDSRVVRAPFPAVAAGSVIEYEVSTRESAPILATGGAERVLFTDSVLPRWIRVTVDAAANVPLNTASQGIPAGSVVTTQNGRHVEVDWKPELRKIEDREFLTPFDQSPFPLFEFSTGASWREVAAAYAAIVEERIRPGDERNRLGVAAKPGESAQQISARVVAALHERVRYTGMHLGDAAIVPAAPADVLARRYGDCKDKATLLVAALREFGLRAHAALLLTGTGLDVNPKLPGFGLFDHAIVYVDGPEPFWIDATAQFTRAGELPAADRGRLALIARTDTPELVRTPDAEASQNGERHDVEMHLADFGPAQITEGIEGTGDMDAGLRLRYGQAEPAKAQEIVEAPAKTIYVAEQIAEFTRSAATDLERPFRITFTAKQARRGYTDEDQAAAGVFLHYVFNGVPYWLSAQQDEKERPRTADFMWPAPYRAEYRYRVHFPPFLKPAALPKNEDVPMGPARFSRSYRHDEGARTVEVTYRFDSGPRRYSAADCNAFRTAFRRVYSTNPEVLQFVSVTGELLALGRTREALRIARAYAAEKKESASAQARLARVLLAGGAGLSARAAARRAVELDAKSTQAWQALGWVYEHDVFGRRFRGDWDPAEAEKAFRTAAETAAVKDVPRMDLAILYEHNRRGDRYGAGARISEAIEIYRSLLEHNDNANIRQNLIAALLQTGDYGGAEVEVKKSQTSAMTILVEALAHGADRAILAAQSLYPDPGIRTAVLLQASASLGQVRRYELAEELAKAAKRASASPEVEQRLSLLSKIRRFDGKLKYGADDPRSVIVRFLAQMCEGDLDTERLRPLFTRLEGFESNAASETSARRKIAGLAGRFRGLGLSREAIQDFVVSLADLEKTGGDEVGYVITGTAGPGRIPPMLVGREDGEYRVMGSSDSLENAGKLVLRLLAAGETSAAYRWLDLAVMGRYVAPGEDEKISRVHVQTLEGGPGGDDAPAAKYLWSSITGAGRTPAAAKVAAASLIGTFSASGEAIAILQEARLRTTNRTDRGNIDLALCQAYARTGQWKELLSAAEALSASFAVAEKRFRYVVRARHGLRQWNELESDARKELEKNPRSAEALRAAAEAALEAGQPDRAGEYVQRILKLDYVGSEERLLAAKHLLLSGKSDPDLRDKLKTDLDSSGIDPATFYLLALLMAGEGAYEEAQRSLAGALEMDDWELLDARAWTAQGRIQEAYGNDEAAAAAYAEARKRAAGGGEGAWAVKLVPAGGPAVAAAPAR